MAVKISFIDTKIPVEIGKLKFEANTSDEVYNPFAERFKKFIDEMHDLEKALEKEGLDESEEFEKLKNRVAELYDELLGKGAFEKVYEQTPNLGLVASIFMQVVAGIEQDLQEKAGIKGLPKQLQEKAKKYKN